MSTAFGRYKARCLARLGLEWERYPNKEVWILTTCRQRRVFASYEAALSPWEALGKVENRCDAFEQEKYCSQPHTLLRGHDEIPLATIDFAAHFEALHYVHKDPEMWQEFRRSGYPPEVRDLAPITFAPATRPDALCVYIISQEGPEKCYKIGRSYSGLARLSELQTGNPYKLRLFGEIRTDNAPALENALHRRYNAFQREGEWFALPISLLFELGDISRLPV